MDKRKMRHRTVLWLMLSALLLPGLGFSAEPVISDAWVRATIGNQRSSGVFFVISSPLPYLIIGAHAGVAERVDMMEMEIADSGPMRPRRVRSIRVPAKESMRLTPLTSFLMLSGMREPLVPGQHISLVLDLETVGGKRSTREFQAVVRPFYLGGR